MGRRRQERCGGYSNDDIKAVIDSERVFRSTTLDDWLEISRDFYQDSTRTKRRPKLLEDEFVTFLRLDARYGNGDKWFEPEEFLNAVWILGKDATVDHETFEALPYYLDEGLCWRTYGGKAFEHFRKYRPPEMDNESFFVSFDFEQVTRAEPEPELQTVAHENCQARCHMGKFEFAVYDFAMGLSRKSGECWLSRKTVGKWTGGMHPQTARKKIDWLVENGWLVEIKAPKAGVGGAGTYHVVDHAEWVSKRGDSACLRKPLEKGENTKE